MTQQAAEQKTEHMAVSYPPFEKKEVVYNVTAQRGDTLRCKGRKQETILRMLENNLHPEVAEDPARLVVYGGIGKAARSPQALAAKHLNATPPAIRVTRTVSVPTEALREDLEDIAHRLQAGPVEAEMAAGLVPLPRHARGELLRPVAARHHLEREDVEGMDKETCPAIICCGVSGVLPAASATSVVRS